MIGRALSRLPGKVMTVDPIPGGCVFLEGGPVKVSILIFCHKEQISQVSQTFDTVISGS